MFDFELFVGLTIDAALQKHLDLVDPFVKKTFINEGGDYLREFIVDGRHFLGKNCAAKLKVRQLELIEANIYSLIRKIIPLFDEKKYPLLLCTFIKK